MKTTQRKQRRTTSQGSDALPYKQTATRAFPKAAQWRYLPQLLGKSERFLLWLSIFVLLIGAGALSVRWYYSTSTLVPAVGGTYTEALVGTPQHINPILTPLSDANADADISSLVFSSIFTYDENRTLQPDLITNYTQDDDTTYTFYLRHGVKWHDGQELNADDVGYTINAIQDPQYNSPLKASLRKVTFTKLDDYSFQLKLPEPYAPFLSSLTFGILPKHIWYNVPPQNVATTDLNLAPVGSGPYAFDSLIKDRSGNIKSMLLLRNDQYYASKPYIQEVKFHFYSDIFTAANALFNGDIDGVSFLPQELVETARKNDNLVLHDLRIPQFSAIYFNQEHSSVLADQDVRSALAYAVDKNAIIKNVLGGEGEPISAPILPGYLGYNPDITKYDYSANQAKEILDKAKWTVPAKPLEMKPAKTAATETLPAPQVQVRAKEKKSLAFSLATVDVPEYRRTAELLQKEWADVGIAVSVDLYTPEQMQTDVLATRNYDAILFSTIVGNDPDPYPFWHSSNQTYPGLALALFSDLESDRFLEDARKTTDEGVRKQKYIAFQDLLAKEVPAIFLYQPRRMYAMNKNILGVKDDQYISIPAHRFASITNWYIKFKRQHNSL